MTSYFDTDIDNLELSEFEKNGLQVYRNYTKSLTEQRQREFVAYINTKPFDPAPLEKMLQKVLQEDARFLPVIACAFADDELKDLFSEAIRPGVPGGKSAMLGPYGPLSTFFNRIQLGYAFDLMSADILEDLDLLRNARNRIAHEWDIRALSEFCDTKHIQKIIEFDMTPLLSGFGYSVSARTNPAVALRLRLIWLLSRLVGECRYYFRAKQLGLDPQQLLLNAFYELPDNVYKTSCRLYSQIGLSGAIIDGLLPWSGTLSGGPFISLGQFPGITAYRPD